MNQITIKHTGNIKSTDLWDDIKKSFKNIIESVKKIGKHNPSYVNRSLETV